MLKSDANSKMCEIRLQLYFTCDDVFLMKFLFVWLGLAACLFALMPPRKKARHSAPIPSSSVDDRWANTTLRSSGVGQWSAQERENRAGKWYVHLNFWPCGTRKASRPERKRDGLYDSEAEALVNVGAWRDHHEQKGNTGGRRTRSEGGAAVNATSTAAGAVSIGPRKHGRKAQREAIVRVSDARWGTMMLTSIRAAKTKLSGAGKRLVQSWGRNQTATRDLHYNHTRDAEYAETRAGVLDDARLWRNSSISLLRACVNNDTAISLIVGYDDDLPEDAYSTHIPASLELK
jgi:hypothetical protein